MLLLALPAAGRAQGTLWRIFTETGTAAMDSQRYPEAERNLQAALEEVQLRADEGTAEVVYRIALSHYNLARLYARTGHRELAQPHFLEAITMMEQSEGHDERALLILTLQHHGLMLEGAGDLEGAEAAFQKALKHAQDKLLVGDQDAMKLVDSLAHTFLLADRRREAEQLYRRTIATLERNPEGNASQIARILGVLGDLYETQGSPMLADALYQRSIELYEKSGLRGGEELATALVRRARMDLLRQDVEQAAEGFRRAMGIFRDLGSEASFEMAAALQAQAGLRLAAKDHDAAVELARESLEILQRTDHPRAREASYRNYRLLAAAHHASGRFKQAESLYRRMLQLYRSNEPVMAELRQEYGALLTLMGRADEARAVLRDERPAGGDELAGGRASQETRPGR